MTPDEAKRIIGYVLREGILACRKTCPLALCKDCRTCATPEWQYPDYFTDAAAFVRALDAAGRMAVLISRPEALPTVRHSATVGMCAAGGETTQDALVFAMAEYFKKEAKK